ncbi:MAG: alpha-amylase family glycosyl hydrolase, partial [Candidatus Nanopelagicales bacterium]|nr:alpha-amylase family glycosyl hydrolase [Candidatus Nanopelagicales bacterium]
LADLNHEAHRRGLRVIGDITLNHCGRAHDWFVRAQDPQAPERGYFRFDPDTPHGYLTWLGVGSLPKFDLTSTGLREVLVREPDSAIRRWIGGDAGFDGWRVDVANMAGRMGEIDVTQDLAREVRSAMALEGDELLLVAEHAHDASDDLRGDGWHGTMNYQGFTRQVWSWLRAPDFYETFLGLPVEVPVITGAQMVASMRAFHGRMPWRSLIASWNILGSHDSARIRTVVGSEERQIAALALAVGLPGVPMVFAGDEFGATGSWGEDSRTTIDWQVQDASASSIVAAYTALLHLRASSPALATGGLRWVDAANDSVAFLREHPTERLLLVVARGQSEAVRIPLADIGAEQVEHVFGLAARIEAGHVVVEIPAAGAGVWRVS